jgi:polyisoprenoid-binding protein YceI
MLEGTKITGKVLKASESEVEVDMTFNGKTKKVKLFPTYEEKAMRLTLKGQINVLDFGMEKNLARLTKACFEKHEGKTWPEVDLNLAAHVMKDCK